jgi:hypothetical protein
LISAQKHQHLPFVAQLLLLCFRRYNCAFLCANVRFLSTSELIGSITLVQSLAVLLLLPPPGALLSKQSPPL